MNVKNNFKFFILTIFILFFSQNIIASNVIDYNTRSDTFSLYSLERVNIFEPIPFRLEIHDKQFKESVTNVKIAFPDYCGPNFFQLLEKEPFPFEIRDDGMYIRELPKDSDVLEFELVVLNKGFLYTSGEGKTSTCAISLEHDYDIARRGKNIEDHVYLDMRSDLNFQFQYYDYDFGLIGVPSFFKDVTETQLRRGTFRKTYSYKKDNLEVDLELNLQDGTKYTYDEIINGEAREFVIFRTWRPSLSETEIIPYSFKLGEGHLGKHCRRTVDSYSQYRDNNFYEINCQYYVTILNRISPITLDLKFKNRWDYGRDANERERIIEEAEKFKKEYKDLLLELAEKIYFESDGKNIDFEILREEKDEEQYCGNCREGYVCSACNECIRKQKAIKPENVEIKTDLQIRPSTKKILNAITEQIIFRVQPNLKFYENGKQIKYCDIEEPGLNIEIIAKIAEPLNNTYSGFTTGFVTDDRELEVKWALELDKGQDRAVFILSPNSRKKFFEEDTEIKQKINFTINAKNIDITKTEEIILEPPKNFEITFNSRTNQIHQGSHGALDIRTKGGTTNAHIIRIQLQGPGLIGATTDTIDQRDMIIPVKQNEKTTIMYSAPRAGNFDIGSALESLSMVKLQARAAESILKDSVLAAMGDMFEGIDELAKAGVYHRKMSRLSDAYTLASGIDTLAGLPGNINNMEAELGNAMGVHNQKRYATGLERAADTGIIIISAAQTAVSVVTLVPNKIPGVSKISAGLKASFSAATNIWKANLQYLSQSEKIERAQEIYYPIPIIVTAQDISGWTTQNVHFFQMVYHQVD